MSRNIKGNLQQRQTNSPGAEPLMPRHKQPASRKGRNAHRAPAG